MTGSPVPRRGASLLAPLSRYVAAWALAGAVAVGLVVGLVDPDGVVLSPTVFVLLGLTMVAETVSVNLRTGESGVTLSLLEAAVVVDVLLLGPAEAAVVVVGAMTLQHLFRRLPLIKIAFNAGEHAVGVALAATLVHLVPASEPVTLGRVLAVLVAIFLYRAISTRALRGVFARVDEDSLSNEMQDPRLEVATSLGNASLGVIASALWISHPLLVWIVGAPGAALFLSYTASYRIEGLFADVRVERDRLDRVMGGVDEGIVLLGRQAEILVWNLAMERITGHASHEAVGRSASELLTGFDDTGRTVDPSDLMLDDGSPPKTVEVRVPDAYGDLVALRLQHRLVHDDAGRCTGDVIVVQDLAREREAAAMKEDFVARVSHELRTPLSPVRAYAQALRNAGDRVSVEQRGHVLDQVIERVDHMSRLVDDLLLVSQIASGRVDPAREVQLGDVDLTALVPRLIDWLGQEHTHDHDIHVVGVEGPALVAEADPMRTGQIVTNLLTNACKYSPAGTPITVVIRAGVETIEVVVEDCGPGIPEDKLEAIFERFERLEDPQRMRSTGLGLGLYISRHLADAMGGRLTVESTRGVGTAFTLSLPCAPRAAHAASADAPLEVLNPAV